MAQKDKPHIVFTLPACMGGVASFNYNIINYSKLIKNFHSKVILIKPKEDNRHIFTDQFMADEVVEFNFSYRENQYIVQQRLNKLLGNEPGAIVTDNGITIQAARRFNNPKTVFQLVHDFFYVSQNIQFGNLIDVAVAHSSFFSDAVFAADPGAFEGRCFYIPYGVRQLEKMPVKNNAVLNLVFLGRLTEGKGIFQLHAIDQLLAKQHIKVNWSIIGKGESKDELRLQWGGNENVQFFEPDSVDEVYNILRTQDIFVFPTTFEGTPVSILECLANAVVTIVHDLPGGIRDIVKDQIGFRCSVNDLAAFADKIAKLHHNRELLGTMQSHCFNLSNSEYDITRNADNYFKLFLQYEKYKRSHKKNAVGLSRLDNKFLPNQVVKTIRKLK